MVGSSVNPSEAARPEWGSHIPNIIMIADVRTSGTLGLLWRNGILFVRII